MVAPDERSNDSWNTFAETFLVEVYRWARLGNENVSRFVEFSGNVHEDVVHCLAVGE